MREIRWWGSLSFAGCLQPRDDCANEQRAIGPRFPNILNSSTPAAPRSSKAMPNPTSLLRSSESRLAPLSNILRTVFSLRNPLCTDQMHLAERELSAFIAAVAELFGADQARMSVERAGTPSFDCRKRNIFFFGECHALGPGNCLPQLH
jgi:hypothetical protein